MNRICIFFILLAVALTGCKTVKQPAQSPYTTDPTEQPKVFSVPASTTKTVEKEVSKIAEEEPIAVRKEQVTFTKQEDKTENETNKFFVIVGSFGQLENAKNFRETLLGEGFTPIILHSETGFYRVCVNSYKQEYEARTRVSQVRQAFNQYKDTWLLIKQ